MNWSVMNVVCYELVCYERVCYERGPFWAVCYEQVCFQRSPSNTYFQKSEKFSKHFASP